MARNPTILVCFGIQMLLLLLATPCHQQSTLLQGQEIGLKNTLLTSSNGMFVLRFGFLDYYDADSREKYAKNFYLGIWYMNQDKNVPPVWIANRNTPLSDFLKHRCSLTIDGRDGGFKILQDGGETIVIFAPRGDSALYHHDRYNSSVTLEDSGNLVLHQLDLHGSIKQIVWQSFDHPTDTLLPGMNFGINHITGEQRSLTSSRSEISAAEGSFTFGIDPNDTTQLIISHRGEPIWKSVAPSQNTTPLFPVSEFKFSYISNENETYISYTVDTSESFLPSLRLEPNGRLSDYYFRGDLRRTSEGIDCGRHPYGRDCVRLKLPKCRNSSGLITSGQEYPFMFTSHLGIMASQGFIFNETENMTLEDCRQDCFQKCSCVAFATTNVDGTGCEIWSSTFGFIRSLPNSHDQRQIYFIDQKKQWWMWVAIAVGSAFTIPPVVSFCYMLWVNFKDEGKLNINLKSLMGLVEENMLPNTSSGASRRQEDDENELKMFNFETITLATNYFCATNKLGEGGFGPVYKGRLANGQEIAIKRLSKSSGQGFTEFRNEVVLVAKLQHTNLVRLLGLCVLEGEMILVYEYMPNKSLDLILFDAGRKSVLDWQKRFQIIDGIAQGLLYLHKYSRLRVIHRDLKASNVLLDDEMNPKISDFGMARIFGIKESETNTERVVGTYGYMSPEYALHGIVSVKVDVFSFGVLLLEIVSGKKNNSFYQLNEKPVTLIGYVSFS
ncbi:G-type lectin S-receptor-like serine/threonine-protein kinase CES101 [Linum grandiflorum]